MNRTAVEPTGLTEARSRRHNHARLHTPGACMLARLCLVVVSLFAVSLALAQEASASRLDAVQKSGKLRICTPGDYKPFSLQRGDGGFEGLDVELVQYAEMAWLLPRDDAAFKAWFDQWMHLAKATGDYDKIVARWLR
jgi:ABC-type amino acid transport substrate-binding protein